MKYELFKRHPKFEDEYDVTEHETIAFVESDGMTLREAQNFFKRAFPNRKMKFAGRFATYVVWERKK